jgi:hypothetical protein
LYIELLYFTSLRMKQITIFILLALFTIQLKAQEIVFSDSVQVSLITCSPGPEVYAKFGHSGLRVLDRVNGHDFIFNWGIFSFNTENFYYKFIRGKTDYLLGVQYTSDFLPEYKRRNSVVWEHVLSLRPSETKRLIDQLLNNYKPENRQYRYNFVFDNCATRPRDIVLGSVDGRVVFQTSFESKTYRQAIGNYIGADTWLRFGIDVIFGYQADKNMPQLQSMFLPEILKYEFLNARISNSQHTETRPLVSKTNILVSTEYKEEKVAELIEKPFYVFAIVLIFIALLSTYEIIFDKKYNTIIDSVLLLVTGIAGTLVFFLMFFSVHPLVKYNLNILWLNPLNVIAAFMIWFNKWRIPIFIFQLFNLILVALALISVAISVQTFNQATFVIIALLLFRYSSWIYRTKKKIVRKSKYKIKQ